MNNLKFRAWDKANKEMLKIDVIDFFLEEIRVLENNGSSFSMKFSDVELMQSTGLFDKNGKEIFEGDIVKSVSFTNWKGVIKFSQKELSYVLEYKGNFLLKDTILLSVFDKEFEIIGNIYEDKELLK